MLNWASYLSLINQFNRVVNVVWGYLTYNNTLLTPDKISIYLLHLLVYFVPHLTL